MLRLACAIAILCVFGTSVWGHDFWINKGKYTGKDHIHCCGVNDCPAIEKSDVEARPDGFFLKTYNETVPYSEATPSEIEADGEARFYRCHKPDGTRRCFFAPYGGS